MTDHSIPIRQRWPALWRAGWIALFPPASLEPSEQLRFDRRALGLCIDCGKKAHGKTLRCLAHGKRARETVRKCTEKKKCK